MVRIILLLGLGVLAWAQTNINGGRNISGPLVATGDVDLSGATITRAVKSGTSLPASCTSGKDLFLKTDEPSGLNLHFCTGTNAWSRVPYAQAASDPGACVVGQLFFNTTSGTLKWCSATNTWSSAAGEANTAQNVGVGGQGVFKQKSGVTLQLRNINGASNKVSVALDDPNNEVDLDVVEANLTLDSLGGTLGLAKGGTGATSAANARTNLGVPGLATSNTYSTGTVQTFTGALVASGSDRTAPAKTGTSAPATCTVGDQFFKTDAGAGSNLYFCTGTNVWTQMTGGGGENVTAGAGMSEPTAGTLDFFPTDPGILFFRDEWFSAPSISDVTVGAFVGESKAYFYQCSATGCTQQIQNHVTNHPGIVRIGTGTTSNSYVNMQTPQWWTDWTVPTWYWIAVVRPQQIITSKLELGFYEENSYGNGVIFEFAPGSSANWRVFVENAWTRTYTNTSVAVAAGSWYKLELRCIASGQIQWSVNGSAWATLSTAPGTNGAPLLIRVTTTDTAAKTMDIDFVAFWRKGITR